MTCSVCGHANTPDARYCSNCGNRLERRCPVCATPYEAGARYCSNCGAALAPDVAPTGGRPDAATPPPAPSAPTPGDAEDLSRWVPDELLRRIRAARAGHTMRGERRTVTMLFADVQGSTAAAERLDPEEWAEVINGAFGRLIAPVYRYEGTLARLQGDAILAFFGAPIAHEDDPVRAVRAGLDMLTAMDAYRHEVVERVGIPVAVRVGINTGLVVVGEVGSDLRVEYTALGDAINVAARMEQTAAPGTVQVTDDTLALLHDSFETERIGPVEVRGRRTPVVAHRVLRVAPVRPEPTAATPLVGRESELARLEAALARLVDGVGGICTIVGEAGIGKSRLLRALRELTDDRVPVATTAGDPGQVSWLAGRARAFERIVPHATFADLLRAWWGATDGAASFETVDAAVERATGAADPDRAGFLTALLGAPLPEEQQQLVSAMAAPLLHDRTTDAVATYLGAEATRRPTVIVLDDMHWADSVSLALAEGLMEVTEHAPLLLVVVMRPVHDDPSWRLQEVAVRDHAHRHTGLTLGALPDEATGALLATLLGGAVDEELRHEVLERADGNPLFVEEIVHSLGDAVAAGTDHHLGDVPFEVPPSLTGLLTSRLDRLDEAARHVAQVVSVIGREFDLDTLAAVLEGDEEVESLVEELTRRGILEERRRRPAAVWSFRHPLIREVAYSTVLLRTRRDLHGRIARHLVTADPTAAPEIAHHFLEAGEQQLAFPYLVDAGQRAVRAMALRDAITAFTRAVEAPPEDADPNMVRDAHEGLGEAWSLVPDLSQAASAFQSLLDYGRACARPQLQIAALNRLGLSTAALGGDWDGAMGFLGQARELAEQSGDDLGLAEYHMNACYVTSMMGDIETAAAHDAEQARLGQVAGNGLIRLTGLLQQTTNLAAVLRWDDARRSFEEALALAEESDNTEAVAILHTDGAAMFALRDGDVAGAIEIMQARLPTLDRYDSLHVAGTHAQMAACAALVGDVEGALSEYAAAERQGRRRGQDFAVAAGMAGRAHVLARGGLTDDLAAMRPEVVALVHRVGGEFLGAGTWADLATATLLAGDLETAAADFRTALDAPAFNRLWERPRILLGLVRTAMLQGDVATARTHLDEARTFAAAHGLRLHEPEVLVLDGALAAMEERDEDAATLLTTAVTAATESGLRLLRVEALDRLADVEARTGDATEAAALRDRAAATVRHLADAIVDPDLRGAFVRTMRPTSTPLAGQP